MSQKQQVGRLNGVYRRFVEMDNVTHYSNCARILKKEKEMVHEWTPDKQNDSSGWFLIRCLNQTND